MKFSVLTFVSLLTLVVFSNAYADSVTCTGLVTGKQGSSTQDDGLSPIKVQMDLLSPTLTKGLIDLCFYLDTADGCFAYPGTLAASQDPSQNPQFSVSMGTESIKGTLVSLKTLDGTPAFELDGNVSDSSDPHNTGTLQALLQCKKN